MKIESSKKKLSKSFATRKSFGLFIINLKYKLESFFGLRSSQKVVPMFRQ